MESGHVSCMMKPEQPNPGGHRLVDDSRARAITEGFGKTDKAGIAGKNLRHSFVTLAAVGLYMLRSGMKSRSS